MNKIRKENLVFKTKIEVPNLSAPISRKSEFCDTTWDFTNAKNERFNSVSASKMQVDWISYANDIPSESILIIKYVALILLHTASKSTSRQRKFNKPNTYCLKVKNLLNLFSAIFKLKREVVPGYEGQLSQFDAFDLQAGLNLYHRESKAGLLHSLALLADCSVQGGIGDLLGRDFQIRWTELDINNLTFPLKQTKTSKDPGTMVIQDDLLQFLIISAATDIYWLLTRLGETLEDQYDFNKKKTLRLPDELNLKKAFQDYTEIRIVVMEEMKRKGSRKAWAYTLRQKFKETHGVSVGNFKAEIERIQSAARYLVIQFTGARYSEVISFKKNALCVKGKQHYLRGTVVKNKGERNPIGNDFWVAIPIVRDAIKILELITNYTFHNYLFATNFGQILNVKPLPFTNNSTSGMLNNYLISIDLERKFTVKEDGKIGCVNSQYLLSTHRLRHTLANQFFKQRKSLLVTSYHFKHAYFAARFYNIPNDVTCGYGNIGQEIFNSPIYSEHAKGTIIDALYAPDSPVAGGGAANFIEARNDFFNGEIKSGKSRSQILKNLARRNLPFADVMLGYCGGKNNFTNEVGEVEEPPCIGQIQCNPGRCGNAVIPVSKIAHWVALLKRNQKLRDDPQMSHAYTYLDFHISEAKNVLRILLGREDLSYL